MLPSYRYEQYLCFFLPVSRLQAKYKGCLGKRAYQKKRKAGTGSGIKDSFLRTVLSSFGRSGIHVAAGSTASFPVGLWVFGSDAGDSGMKGIRRGAFGLAPHSLCCSWPRSGVRCASRSARRQHPLLCVWACAAEESLVNCWGNEPSSYHGGQADK